jgi:hypothetical protein
MVVAHLSQPPPPLVSEIPIPDALSELVLPEYAADLPRRHRRVRGAGPPADSQPGWPDIPE